MKKLEQRRTAFRRKCLHFLQTQAQNLPLLHWESPITKLDRYYHFSPRFQLLISMSPKYQIDKEPCCTSSYSRDLPVSSLSKDETAALPNVWHATKVLLKVVQCEHGNVDLQRCLLRQQQLMRRYILKLKEIKATVNMNCSAPKMFK